MVNFRLTCKVSRQSNRISLFCSSICIKCYKLKRVHQPAEFLHFVYPTAALVFGQSATAMRLADWPFWLAGGSAVQWRRSEGPSVAVHTLYRPISIWTSWIVRACTQATHTHPPQRKATRQLQPSNRNADRSAADRAAGRLTELRRLGSERPH